MTKLSRRDFLKSAVAGMGALAVGALLDACSAALPSPPASTSTPSPTPELPTAKPISPTATNPAPSETPPAPTSTPQPPPDVVVTRAAEPEELVRRAISALGGMDKFVSQGARVIVKPNICVDFRNYEYAATTNPWVVGTLVKLCYEAGASSVKVMDFPFNGTPEQAYQVSGIKEQVEAAGGEMAYMLSDHFVPTDNPSAVALKKTSVYDEILQADVLINVPIAKQHGNSRLSLGMKNLMGVIWNRSILHNDLAQCIADLNALVRPQLTVIDAVRILTAYGPTGGSLNYVKKLDTLIASRDVVAADSYAAGLFGLKPDDLAYIVAGTRMGLGRSDLQNLRIQEITLGA
jgi:uncharacterized protein (DUF362 family)